MRRRRSCAGTGRRRSSSASSFSSFPSVPYTCAHTTWLYLAATSGSMSVLGDALHARQVRASRRRTTPCLARCGTSSATAPRPTADFVQEPAVLLCVAARHRPARRLAVADDAVVEIVEEALVILSREVELGALQHRAPLVQHHADYEAERRHAFTVNRRSQSSTLCTSTSSPCTSGLASPSRGRGQLARPSSAGDP